MDDKNWVLVRSFEELATGMRAAVPHCKQLACSRGGHVGIVGDLEFAVGITIGGAFVRRHMRDLIGEKCSGRQFAIDAGAVNDGLVFRYAADLGISDQLAREANPFLARYVIGTAGRDEVVIARKERTR